MSLRIVKGSLLNQRVDAIVVPSQPSLRLEGSVGGQVKEVCGKELLLELEQCKNINISECVIANSYNNNFKKVILVANPKWDGGKFDEENNLHYSYLSCLEKAQDFGLNSIAFPLLSIGAYKFPKRKAIKIAIKTITDFIEYDDLDVYLVVYNESVFKTYRDLFINYEIINGPLSKESGKQIQKARRERNFSWYSKNIDSIIAEGCEGKTFAERLDHFISKKSITSKSLCYKRVVSRNQFFNYLNGKSKPNKYTAVSLGINMKLDVCDINVLLEPLNDLTF